MRTQLVGLILVSLAVVACTDESENLSSGTHGVVTTNRITSNRIAGNRIAGNRIAANNWDANEATMGELLATPEGQELLSFLIGCALPEGVTITADDTSTPAAGDTVEFFGEIGVAPEWINRALDDTDRRWVSACILSRVNDNNVTVEISIRGPHPALATVPSERVSHPIEEGAFYGDIFGPVNRPLAWYACRGRAQAAGEVGGLNDRDCTEPDPAHPGYTQCGFIFAGDCADYAPPRNNYACERFSLEGYYVSCETTATHTDRPGAGTSHGHGKSHHGHGVGHTHHGNGHGYGHDKHDCDDDDDDDDDDDVDTLTVFDEVVTTFLKP